MREIPDQEQLLEHITDWALKYAALRFSYTAALPNNFPKSPIQSYYANVSWHSQEDMEQALISRGIVHDAHPEDDALLNLSPWYAAPGDNLHPRGTANRGTEDQERCNWLFFLTYKMSPKDMRYIGKFASKRRDWKKSAETEASGNPQLAGRQSPEKAGNDHHL